MELAFERNTAAYLRRALHETLSEEAVQETVIPDSMPDANRILVCNAQPELQSKICREQSLQLSGQVRAHCLYLPEDETEIQVIQAEIPFSMRLESPALQEDTQTVVRIFARSAEARLINSRKLLLRVGLCAVVDGYARAEAVTYTVQDAPPCVQLRTRTYPLRLAVEAAERSIQLSEELELPQGRPAIERVIGWSVLPDLTEEKLIGNKAVFRGGLQLRITYFDREGSVSTAVFSIPLSQYCELQQDYEDESVTVTPVITGSELEPMLSGDQQRLLFGCGMLAQCLVTTSRPITVCEDAYTTKGSLACTWTDLELPQLLDDLKLRQPLRESVQVQADRVLDARIYPDVPVQSGSDSWELPAAVNVLYLDTDGSLQGSTLHAQAQVQAGTPQNGTSYAVSELLPDGYVGCGAGAIELRCELFFELESYAGQKLKTLSGAELTMPETRAHGPSVVICRTTADLDVWDLAKSYGSTVQAIQSANHLTDTLLSEGTMVLIPM